MSSTYDRLIRNLCKTRTQEIGQTYLAQVNERRHQTPIKDLPVNVRRALAAVYRLRIAIKAHKDVIMSAGYDVPEQPTNHVMTVYTQRSKRDAEQHLARDRALTKISHLQHDYTVRALNATPAQVKELLVQLQLELAEI